MANKNNQRTTESKTIKAPGAEPTVDEAPKTDESTLRPGARYRVRLNSAFRNTTSSGRHVRAGIEIPADDAGVIAEVSEEQLTSLYDDPHVIVEDAPNES